MNRDIARQVARDPAPHGRVELAKALDVLLRELEATESRLAETERLRTLGGVPPRPVTDWANKRVETPAVHVDYTDLAEKTP